MDLDEHFKANEQQVDPAAEFLAREQSAFGDLDSEIILNKSSGETVTRTTKPDDANGNGDSNELVPASTSGGLESSMGSFEMLGGESCDPVSVAEPPASRSEPEKIRKWREEQKKCLEEKDCEEERKREELRLQATKELEDWLRQIEELIANTKAAARSAEKQSAAIDNGAMEPGTEWERIAKLCDFNPKVNKSGKDISRMRSIYLHLKQNPVPIHKSAGI